MLTFMEYIEWRRRKGLPDPATMLRMIGIDPEGPHEVEVQKFVKRWMISHRELRPRLGLDKISHQDNFL